MSPDGAIERYSPPAVPVTTDAPAYRTPPHNLEAEQALLGALMVNNITYERVADMLEPDHFFEPVHQRLYAACARLCSEGRLANPVTLKPLFDADGALADVGPGRYLAQLAASVVTIINARDYARQIVDLWQRRQLIEIGSDIVNEAYEQDLDFAAIDQLGEAQKRLDELDEKRTGAQALSAVSDSIDEVLLEIEAAYQAQGRMTGISTGLVSLDKKLAGLHRTDLFILAGRPSMGKSALAMDLAYNVASKYACEKDGDGNWKTTAGGVVAFFSLEMSKPQLVKRMISSISGVNGDRIRQGTITREEFDRCQDHSSRLTGLPLHIDDRVGQTVAQMRASARVLKRKFGLDLIIIDYLQLMGASGRKKTDINRTQEVSEITRGLKGLAKELNVPVIALSQLSRAVETRDDKRPQLSDLRESGSIEQDADTVAFVYREEYYLSRAEPGRKSGEDDAKFNARYQTWTDQMASSTGKAEVIIGKQRHGPIGTAILAFDGNGPTFRDLYSGEVQ